MNYADKVNVFYGSEETVKNIKGNISDSWVYLKGMCGNTHPGATEPFGKVSVCAYSGGYPTGYGNHCVHCSGKVGKFSDVKSMLGFSHVQVYGTGTIGIYSNFCIVSPLYEKTDYCLTPITAEDACPGYYTATAEKTGIKGEVTVFSGIAHHRYHFDGGGILRIDFSNDGLRKEFGKSFYSLPEEFDFKVADENTVTAYLKTHGLKKYFAVRVNKISKTETETENGARVCYIYTEGVCNLKFAVSLKSETDAISQLDNDRYDFDTAKSLCKDEWNKKLSAVEAEFENEKDERLFYTLFYQSLIKPADFSGENYICDEEKFFTDFATMWDIYKTQLPLIFTLYKYESEAISKTFTDLFRRYGFFPNRLLLGSEVEKYDNQARMLMLLSLADAFLRGTAVDTGALDNIEFERPEDGYPSQILDLICASHALEIIKGEKAHTISLKEIYDNRSGLLRTADYYEGGNWNYSFRLLPDMYARIAICGIKKFEDSLDVLFGFKEKTDSQYKDKKTLIDGKPATKNMFEGFNNESDMEAPYNYIYLLKPEKLDMIIKSSMTHLDVDNNGAFPGNCDSGGLSACILWNMLGIFPVSGQNKILLGSPVCKRAVIHLSNGKTAEIINNGSCSPVFFNSENNELRQISVTDFMNGCEIIFGG